MTTASALTSRRLVLVLAVLVLVAGAATAYLATRPDRPATAPTISKDGVFQPGTIGSTPGEDAIAATVATLPLALSYDYRHLDQGLADATAHMTSTFGSRFTSTFDKTAKPQAQEQKAVANALVRGAGLVDLDGDHATCLAYVNQVLVSSRTMSRRKTPVKLTQSRVLVKLVHQRGGWLVDSIEPL